MPISDIIPHAMLIAAGAFLLGAGGIIASVHNTRLKIKNGYPLETTWGLPLHPTSDRETAVRIKLLTGENAQLRAELGSVKDRLETIERIVTDRPSQLAREIETLALDKGAHA